MKLNNWLNKYNIYLFYLDENTIEIKDTGEKFLEELRNLDDYFASWIIPGLIILKKNSN